MAPKRYNGIMVARQAKTVIVLVRNSPFLSLVLVRRDRNTGGSERLEADPARESTIDGPDRV